MIRWIQKLNPAKKKRILGINLISATGVGTFPFFHHIRVYELRVVQPYGGTYLSRGQYHSLEHIFVQEALDNLGADCISVSASGDNTTYRFVVTGKIKEKQLARFVLAVLYDGESKYLTASDVPYCDLCSYGQCHEVGDLFRKISPALGKVLTEML